MSVRRAITPVLSVLALTTVLVAQAPALDVKLGLWENTVVTRMEGAAMPQIDSSKLPPEQAAKIAEAMKAMMGDRTTTEKHCLTKEDLAKDSFMLPQDGKMACKRTITANTASTFAADLHCTGENEAKGQINVESLSGGSAYKAAMKMAATSRGRTMNMTMTMTGKYLGPDCGGVK